MEETINTIIDMIVSTACPPAQPAPAVGPLLPHNPHFFTFCLAESQHGAVGECSPVPVPMQPPPATWGLGGTALLSLGAPPEPSTALPLTVFSFPWAVLLLRVPGEFSFQASTPSPCVPTLCLSGSV